ncbi:AGE family epimerase/isomerase [Bradyrhizobium sp. INPA03-11B]|uniref:AGE family epimerase/isomerase n=1 Tax=Bradyrhizobium sp. INPA03-11B TaxID=418598 RepID=UPI00338EB170
MSAAGWRGLPSHRAWLEAEARSLFDFARGARVERGFGWLDDHGKVLAGQSQPLWITARFTHVFGLANLLGYPGAGPLCDHGVRTLLDDYVDVERGGWFAELRDGRPSRPEKEAYSHAFVVLALSTATVAGRPSAREGLRRTLELVEQRFWREDEGACCEAYDAAWILSEPYRGANANMHMVESFLAAADALDRPHWAQRALRIAERIINRVARAADWRVVEHFDAHWTPLPDCNSDVPDHPFRPFGVTPGHGLEWSRLLLGLRAQLAEPPTWLLEAAQGLFDRAVTDGWAEPGGFVYTTDHQGKAVTDRRLHWVVTEAIGAAAALHEATGKDVYEIWYRRIWDFAAQHLIDRVLGGWRHELDAHLTPVEGTWSGKPDIYHAFQSVLIPRLPLAGSLAGALAGGPLR